MNLRNCEYLTVKKMLGKHMKKIGIFYKQRIYGTYLIKYQIKFKTIKYKTVKR